jgi:hypothetical protein
MQPRFYYYLLARPPPFVKPPLNGRGPNMTNGDRTMNILSRDKQAQIVTALVEGNSIRSTARIVGVEHKTVMRVLLRCSKKCQQLLESKMRRLPCKIIQVDEIWTFVAKKEKRLRERDNPETVGDQYVFVALDSESRF